jgi:hypothetical protein
MTDVDSEKDLRSDVDRRSENSGVVGFRQGRFLSMNLQVLKKTRRKPEAGDIFAMLPPDAGGYLFGRVIQTNANPLGVGGGILIYVYQPRSQGKETVPVLFRDQLLIPPMITNRLGWSRGYFEFLEHHDLGRMDRLRQHCFKDSRGLFFDEQGSRLTTEVPPVGEWGLHSYRTIDDEISSALGIPLSVSEGSRH